MTTVHYKQQQQKRRSQNGSSNMVAVVLRQLVLLVLVNIVIIQQPGYVSAFTVTPVGGGRYSSVLTTTTATATSNDGDNSILRPITRATTTTTTSTSLSMGWMDAINKAFSNTEYGPPPEAVRATARHILVPTKQEAHVCMKMITSGEMSFADCAQDFSTCPSSTKGGSLGSFGPGTMVPEFDKVIFSPDTQIGQLVGPVLTEFGYHVIVVEKRTGGGDKY